MSDRAADDGAKAGWIASVVFGIGWCAFAVWGATTGSLLWGIAAGALGVAWLVRGFLMWRRRRDAVDAGVVTAADSTP
jgi:hypothetical protein